MSSIPYGEWFSPITAADVARSGVALSFPTLVDDELWWSEMRPSDEGRTTVVRRRTDGSIEDVLPAPWIARTRVHEYGGRSWLPLPGGGLVFANWADQRLYLLAADGEPAALTPEPVEPCGLRYAAPALGPDGSEVLCVREAYADGRVSRHVVAVPLDGSGAADAAAVREVVGGSDFVADPRVSPDGRRIAWIAWDHPQMPWDGTELRVADLIDGVAGPPRTLMGGPAESVMQPEWADENSVYAVSDRSGWWNLYRVNVEGLGDLEPLCERAEEFGFPMWLLGYSSYAVLQDGCLAVLHGSGTVSLGVLDPATGGLTDLDLPFPVFRPTLSVAGSRVAALAGSPTQPLTVIVADAVGGDWEWVRASSTGLPDQAYLPSASSEALPAPGGRVVHAHIWAPCNGDLETPTGSAPPYVVFVHGGPTAQSVPLLDLEIAYLTSRGIGVLDVNYGGSSGYGRAYRELLVEQWGVVDVEDCIAAATALVERGDADPHRLAIRGGSAGGWTTLAALTRTDFFAAGVSYYGVAELLRFAEDTHDFESRYLDRLVGPLPQTRERYVERAPLSHVDDVSCPVLLLQGAEDEVVPTSQSTLFRDALARKGIPHAYLEFPGEQHGFRMESTLVAAYEAELSFYGQVFGFDPPGIPRLELMTDGAPATG